jgi:regulator of RNase E activity RraB
MGILDIFRKRKSVDPDDSVLLQLQKAGSNLSKPHQVEFFLYFPTQTLAEQASSQIQELGFTVEVRPGAKGNDWLCFATKTMVPELSDLQNIRDRFARLAASCQGEYDGWGTGIEA